MAISSSIRKSGPYSGNGLSTTFPFGFKIFDDGDVHVVRSDAAGNQTVLVLGSDFTVTLNGDQDAAPGGRVVLTAPLASGYLLMLTSDLSELQPTVLTNSGGFYPDVLNDSLDRLTILTQQLREKVDRAVVAPITESAGATLPPASARAGKVAWFDDDGQLSGWMDVGTMASAFDAVLAGSEPLRLLIGDLPPGKTFAQTAADIAESADLFKFGRFGVDIAFFAEGGGPSFRIGADQRSAVTDLAGFQFSRGSPTTGLNLDGTLVQATGDTMVFTDLGLFFGHGGINKVATYADTPIGLVGVDQVGDNAATISLIDDTAALTAAGLQGLVSSGKVIKVDNSHGTQSAWIAFRNASTLTAGQDVRYRIYGRCHAAGMFMRGGIEDLPLDVNAETQPNGSTTYVVLSNTVQAGGTNSRVYGKANAGSIAYFCLPYLGLGTLNTSVPLIQKNPGTFTGIAAANLALTVLDPTAPTNLSVTEGTGVLTCPNDTAELPISSIIPSKTTARVYRLDNSAAPTANSVAVAACSATTSGQSYLVYTFMRVVNAVAGAIAWVGFEGNDIQIYADAHWNMIGKTVTATTSSAKIHIKAGPGAIVEFVDLIVQAGTVLPATLAPWALGDTPAVLDDQMNLVMSESYGDFYVEWGRGMQTLVRAPASGTANIALGSAGKMPWVGNYVTKFRSKLASEALNVYTPVPAIKSVAYTRAYVGQAYDPALFPHLAFSDDFDSLSIADTDTGIPSDATRWFAPGHTDFTDGDGIVWAYFKKPSEAPVDTYAIVDGKLRIRLQKGSGDMWTTGCISSINSSGQGFTFSKGYAEARLFMPQSRGAWGAWWATSELPGLALPHAEIDFVELYGTNPENLHGTVHHWPGGHANPNGSPNHWQSGHAPKITALDGDYHTYGCAITDQWIIHYKDRVEWGRVPLYGECRLAPFKLLLNLALNTTERVGAVELIDMYVDYVKVWTE